MGSFSFFGCPMGQPKTSKPEVSVRLQAVLIFLLCLSRI